MMHAHASEMPMQVKLDSPLLAALQLPSRPDRQAVRRHLLQAHGSEEAGCLGDARREQGLL